MRRRANHAPRIRSNARQNPGHQWGTLGSSITKSWRKSNTPCFASAAAMSQRFFLNPSMANDENPVATAISIPKDMPRSSHYGEQHIVGGDHHEDGWVKGAFVI